MISRRQFLRGSFSAPEPGPATAAPGTAQLARIGPACIALAQNVVCRSCGDACETGAIRFPPRVGGVALPTLLSGSCTGCGECVAACPAGAIHLAPTGQPVKP